MLEEFMSDFSNDLTAKKNEGLEDRNEVYSKGKKEIIDNEKKNVDAKQGRRRGVWRRVRVRPADGFETAESQNIGTQFFNSIRSEDSKEIKEKGFENEKPIYNAQPLVELMEEFKTVETTTQLSSQEEIDLGTGAPTVAVENTEVTTIFTTDAPVTTEMNEITTETIENETIASTFMPEVMETTDLPSLDEDRENAPYRVQDTQKVDDDYDVDFEPNANTENIDKFREEMESGDEGIFDKVKQKLTDLFSMNDSETYDEQTNMYRPKYTDIQRQRYDTPLDELENEEINHSAIVSTTPVPTVEEEIISTTPTNNHIEPVPYSKDPMGSLIFATSTSTEVSHETEICYRGRCVKTEDKKKH